MVASDRNDGTCPRPSCGFGMIIDDLVALWSNRHCIKMDNEAALVTTMVFTFLIFVLSTSILLGTQVLTIRSLFLHNLGPSGYPPSGVTGHKFINRTAKSSFSVNGTNIANFDSFPDIPFFIKSEF